MSEENDKWLNAFTGRSEPDNADEKQARALGDKMRSEYDKIQVDEQQANAFIQYLREKKINQAPAKQSKSQWSTSVLSLVAAAMLVLTVIPLLMTQHPPNISDYPVLRGSVESLSIKVSDVASTAFDLQKKLKDAGYSPKIYQYLGHLLLSIELKDDNTELLNIFKDYNLTANDLIANRQGKLRIELLPSK
jgi:hypothetical protein